MCIFDVKLSKPHFLNQYIIIFSLQYSYKGKVDQRQDFVYQNKAKVAECQLQERT